MNFEDFIKKGSVRRASPDEAMVKSLIETALLDLKFLNSLDINEMSSRRIMVNYYDALRSILEAVSSLDCYKIYSHEAFTYFLKEKGEDIMARKFDRFRKIRNSINYYGKDIAIEETKENVEDIKKMIDVLINKYLRGNK